MNLVDYTDAVKDELEKLIEESGKVKYEKTFFEFFEENEVALKDICNKLSNFNGDIWEMCEIVVAVIYEVVTKQPGSAMVAKIVMKLFHDKVETVCAQYLI